jgi:hypothetical protein
MRELKCTKRLSVLFVYAEILMDGTTVLERDVRYSTCITGKHRTLCLRVGMKLKEEGVKKWQRAAHFIDVCSRIIQSHNASSLVVS